MKLVNFAVVFILISLTALSCSGDPNNTSSFFSGKVVKVLPLGDSRVQGSRPQYESYRYELWKHLVNDNNQFDFIGPISDSGSYPKYNKLNFDVSHAGVGGFTTQDILDNMVTNLSSGTPDIVLLGIGTNDLLRNIPVTQVIANINNIIKILQENNPNITIFIEQIVPARSDVMTSHLATIFDKFNAGIPVVASWQTNTNSKVIVVDMTTQWKDEYMADSLHYNQAGAKIIADRYYEAIKRHMKME